MPDKAWFDLEKRWMKAVRGADGAASLDRSLNSPSSVVLSRGGCCRAERGVLPCAVQVRRFDRGARSQIDRRTMAMLLMVVMLMVLIMMVVMVLIVMVVMVLMVLMLTLMMNRKPMKQVDGVLLRWL
jgi:hypothetical protein